MLQDQDVKRRLDGVLALYDKYALRLRRMALAYFAPHEANDLMSETFLALCERCKEKPLEIHPNALESYLVKCFFSKLPKIYAQRILGPSRSQAKRAYRPEISTLDGDSDLLQASDDVEGTALNRVEINATFAELTNTEQRLIELRWAGHSWSAIATLLHDQLVELFPTPPKDPAKALRQYHHRLCRRLRAKRDGLGAD